MIWPLDYIYTYPTDIAGYSKEVSSTVASCKFCLDGQRYAVALVHDYPFHDYPFMGFSVCSYHLVLQPWHQERFG